MDHSAIQKIRDLSSPEDINNRLARITHNTVIVSPDSLRMTDLEEFLPSKRRMQATMRTEELESFAAYCEHMTSQFDLATFLPVFVDAEAMSAKAVFDFGTVETPLHGDNQAVLALTKTAEYQGFLNINNCQTSQRGFAEWMEDFKENVTAYDSKGEKLSFAGAVDAVRKYEVSEKTEAGSEERNFSSRKTAMTEVSTKNADKMPAFIGFRCKPYADLKEREIMARVSVLNGRSPEFVVRAILFEKVKEEIAKEFCELVEGRLNCGVPKDASIPKYSVFIGSI